MSIKVGINGFGRIGRMVGEKAQALGMQVLSTVHRNKPEGCECETMQFVSMDELLSRSDILVLCAPSGDKPLVDAESLQKMKDGVVIINVSRGANVDEAALLDALNSGKVRAAGLGAGPASVRLLYAPHRCGHQGGPKAHRRRTGGYCGAFCRLNQL